MSDIPDMRTEPAPEALTHAAPMSGVMIGEPNRKLRVCVLHPSAEGTVGPFTEEVDGICKPDHYDPEGYYEWTNVFLKKATSTADLIKLINSGSYDVFLNLCDGAWDEDRAGKDVVEALERLNVPYTGADALFYEPSKIDMKKAAYFYGIKVPEWVHIQGGPGLEEVGVAQVLASPEAGGLRFPLIVKHPSGYGSVGMTKQSKVANEDELRQQVSFFCKEYGGALVEEFIAGREFTVLVVEEPPKQVSANPKLSDLVPVAYTPVECVFGPGEDFKHFDLKFLDYENLSWRPCDNPDLTARLKAAAQDTYLATRGVSYGRCDFRVEEGTGDVYFLEINPNCGVLYPPELAGSADYILSLDPEHNHRHFIASILASAVHRHRCKQPAVAAAFISSFPLRRPGELKKEQALPPPPQAAGSSQAVATAAAAATATGGASAAAEQSGGNGVAVGAREDEGASGEGKPAVAGVSDNTRTSAEADTGAAAGAGAAAEPELKAADSAAVTEAQPESAAASPADGSASAAEAAAAAKPSEEKVGAAAAVESAPATAPAQSVRRAGGSGRRLGMVAIRPIAAGGLVQAKENTEFSLASRRWVERTWPTGSRERRMFDEVAYPLNEQVLVMPPADLTKWTPLTHSCNPNTQLNGLDLVARRDIARGEVITVDFATLFGAKLPGPYDCSCGAAGCRRRVTAQDYLLPDLLRRYDNDNVTAFVAEARARHRKEEEAQLMQLRW